VDAARSITDQQHHVRQLVSHELESINDSRTGTTD
jgi:hypothetical protein